MVLMNKANNPLIAAGFLFKGFKLLSNPKLRTFILIPILINIVLYGVALALGYYYVDKIITQLIPTSLQWLNWILWPLFFIIFFLVGFFTFTIFANVIASPFYGLLSAKTQGIISGKAQIVEEPFSRVIAAELKRVLYIVKRILPLFLLLFIPVINIIAPFLLSLFGAWCLAMEFMAYPLENEGLLFVDQKQFLKTVRLGALGFGAVTMIGLTIPVLNIIVGPAAVIGSTMYVYEMREKQQA